MAKIPNATDPIVETAKITHYLLSDTHPDGAPKAYFFKRFGFSLRKWQVLRDALVEHVASCEFVTTATTPFGIVYEVEGPESCPEARTPTVRVVWFIRSGEVGPRLVTAGPA